MNKPVNIASVIPVVSDTFGLTLSSTASLDELKQALSTHVNYLINHDFEKLVNSLYRIDVNEEKMRYLLEQTEGENAASLIAELIIERQLQKMESRQQNKSEDNIPDDEKW